MSLKRAILDSPTPTILTNFLFYLQASCNTLDFEAAATLTSPECIYIAPSNAFAISKFIPFNKLE